MDKEQIEEMARVYDEARLKARETLGSMNEGEAMWYSKAFYSANYRKVERGEWKDKRCTKCGEEMWYKERSDALVRIFNRVKSNFCPECGADMRGNDNER